MSVAFIADVHIGNHTKFGGYAVAGANNRCQQCLNVLQKACQIVPDGCNHLVIIGDLFDRSDTSPQIVAMTMGIISAAQRGGLDFTCIVGNHEMVSGYPGDTSLAPLDFLPSKFLTGTVVDRPQHLLGSRSIACIPHGITGTAEDWIEAVLSSKAHHTKIVAMHAGIYDDGFPAHLKKGTAIHVDRLVEIASAHGVTHVFAGDYHIPKVWHRNGVGIFQCGALCPTEFGEAPGYLFLLNANNVTRHVIAGPRFVRLHWDNSTLSKMIAIRDQAHEDGDFIFWRITASQKDLESVHSSICAANIPDGTYEILLDAGSAATPVYTSGGTVAEIVEEYMKKLDMPGVLAEDMQEVRANVKKFLQSAGAIK